MPSLAHRVIGSALLATGLSFGTMDVCTAASDQTLEQRLREEERAKREAMIGPSVYLGPIVGKYEGSAVIVYAGPIDPEKRGTEYEHYLLTVLHNTNELITTEGGKEKRLPVSGKVFDPHTQKPVEEFTAELVAYDQKAQLALLRFVSKKRYAAAKIISERGAKDLNVFRAVYAVGCHDGAPPSQTQGEISSCDDTLEKRVNGTAQELTYWRTTARYVYGASGGGIYTDDTHELIGMIESVGIQGKEVYGKGKDGKPDTTNTIGFIREQKDSFNYFTPPTTIRKFLKDKGYSWMLEGKTNPAAGKDKKK